MNHRILSLHLFLITSLTVTNLSAINQEYPTKPIRFIVPFPPGGSTDTYARIIGVKLASQLLQPVILDNRSGAGGALGVEVAAHAAPDGYTIVLGQDGNMVVGQAMRQHKSYDVLTHFQPISLVVRTPQVIVVNDNSPFKTLSDLILAAKSHSGKLTFATAGTASSSHIMGAFFNKNSGINTIHVPYKGGLPGMLDLHAGRVSYMITSMVSSLNFTRDGRARLLAVSGEKRSHLFPDVPTVKESGISGFDATLWHGVFAPTKVSRSIVTQLNREIAKVLAIPEIQKQLQFEGGIVSPSSPEAFTAFIRADVVRWNQMIKVTGISLE
jgi:tripartite-type tricarboxylate transporter receptor subunit TctC